MRILVTIDNELLRRAQELTGIATRSKLLREALVALVYLEISRRLARLGGSEPDLQPVKRRCGLLSATFSRIAAPFNAG